MTNVQWLSQLIEEDTELIRLRKSKQIDACLLFEEGRLTIGDRDFELWLYKRLKQETGRVAHPNDIKRILTLIEAGGFEIREETEEAMLRGAAPLMNNTQDRK